jgi:hypothetical protein
MESRTSRDYSDWYPKVMAQQLEGPTEPRQILPPRSPIDYDDARSRLLQSDVRRVDRQDQQEYFAQRFSRFFARFRKPKGDADAGRSPTGPVFDPDYASKVEEAKANLDRTTQALIARRNAQRKEDIRRISKTGNFAEGWLTPENGKDTR